MASIFLCYGAADSAAAEELAAWLERGTRFSVELSMIPAGETALTWFERGLGLTAVIVLLSPEVVPSEPRFEEWAPLLNEPSPLATVVVRKCRYARLLERRQSHFTLADRRRLKQWLQSLIAGENRILGVPAAVRADLPPRYLEALREAVCDRPGAARVPPEDALAVARHFADDFERVIWMNTYHRSLAGVLGDLAWRAGLTLVERLEEARTKVESHYDDSRYLLILDGPPVELTIGGRTSVLNTDLGAPAYEDPQVVLKEASARRAHEDLGRLERVLYPLLESGGDWDLASRLGSLGATISRDLNRLPETQQFLTALSTAARAQSDARVMAFCEQELRWLHAWWGEEISASSPPLPGEQLGLGFF